MKYSIAEVHFDNPEKKLTSSTRSSKATVAAAVERGAVASAAAVVSSRGAQLSIVANVVRRGEALSTACACAGGGGDGARRAAACGRIVTGRAAPVLAGGADVSVITDLRRGVRNARALAGS